MADPPLGHDPDAPAVSVRREDGALSNFDEIVTPHPVVAFLFRRRTAIVLLGIVAMVPFAKPRLYWLIAGGYTVLYFNSQQCWSDPPVGIHTHTRWIYADRLPSACAGGAPMDLLRKFPPAIRSL